MAVRQNRTTNHTKRNRKPLPSTELFLQYKIRQNRRNNGANHIRKRCRLQTDMVDGVDKKEPI